MNTWNPHNLFECFHNDFLAWTNIMLGLGIVVWYLVIAFTTWIPAMRGASHAAGRSMFWMAVIFVFCSLAGYATISLAGFMPKTAYILRTIFLLIQNIVCPIFLMSKSNQDFKVIGRQQQIGLAVLSAEFATKSDAELALMVRKACQQHAA